jgi:hypothetical protein
MYRKRSCCGGLSNLRSPRLIDQKRSKIWKAPITRPSFSSNNDIFFLFFKLTNHTSYIGPFEFWIFLVKRGLVSNKFKVCERKLNMINSAWGTTWKYTGKNCRCFTKAKAKIWTNNIKHEKVVNEACEWIIKQFMCEWIVEWTHCACKALKNRLEQNFRHNKVIFNV